MLTWPLREHRMEHAAHPDGRGQRAFVGRQRAPGAQQVAVRAQHREFFRAQDDVAVVARGRRRAGAPCASRSSWRRASPNKRARASASARSSAASGAAVVKRFGTAAPVGDAVRHAGGCASGKRERRVDGRQIGVDVRLRDGRTARGPNNPRSRAGAGCEVAGIVLQCGHRVFVLQARRQAVVGEPTGGVAPAREARPCTCSASVA